MNCNAKQESSRISKAGRHSKLLFSSLNLKIDKIEAINTTNTLQEKGRKRQTEQEGKMIIDGFLT